MILLEILLCLIMAIIFSIIILMLIDLSMSISVIGYFISLQYDLDNIEIRPERDRYGEVIFAVLGIELKGHPVRPIEIGVGYNTNEFVLRDIERNQIGFRTKCIIGSKLLMQRKELDKEDFDNRLRNIKNNC